MISIIICSRTTQINKHLSQNIDETIGCDYELIVIDNSQNAFSIFEAYNLGIEKSKGDYWCFVHDDVLFHTKGWGRIIDNIFKEDSQIGLIGVAGSKVKTKMPSAWWDCPVDQRVIHIIQHINKNKIEKWNEGWQDEGIEEVAVIDGVFMVGKKDSVIQFDERLQGFHNYDLNLSLTYHLNQYKVVVTQNVLLEHFSMGTINKSWYESALQFDELYRKYLPLKIDDSIAEAQLKAQEFKNGMLFCVDLLQHDSKIKAIAYWFRLFTIKPVSKFHLRFFKLLHN